MKTIDTGAACVQVTNVNCGLRVVWRRTFPIDDGETSTGPAERRRWSTK